MADRNNQYANWLLLGLIVALVAVVSWQVFGLSVPAVGGFGTDSSDRTGLTGSAGDTSSASGQSAEGAPSTETTTGQIDGTPSKPASDELRKRLGPPAQMPDVLSAPETVALQTSFETESERRKWSISGRGQDRGGVAIVDGTLRIHVDQCYTATARRKLGRYNGTIRISFEWLSTAEQWWERPGWRLTGPDGTSYEYTLTRGHDVTHPQQGATRANVTVATATVDGPVFIEYYIRPSQHCQNPDHGITALYVDELIVERTK